MEFDARGLMGTIIADRYFVGELDAETDVATTFDGIDTRTGAMVTIGVSPAASALTTAAEVHHPNIVTPRDLGVLASGALFVVTARLAGATLARRVCACGGLVTGDVIRVGLDLLSALAAAHDSEVVHGDLRPESVFLVERDGLVLQTLLSGFGRRGSKDASFTAPELTAGSTPSISADLYAVAALLHYAATGFAPPQQSSAASLRASLRWLPTRVSRVIARALDVDPASRFSSAREMLHALDVGRGRLTSDSSAEPASVPRIPMSLDAVRPIYNLRADDAVAVRESEVVRLRSDVVPSNPDSERTQLDLTRVHPLTVRSHSRTG